MHIEMNPFSGNMGKVQGGFFLPSLETILCLEICLHHILRILVTVAKSAFMKTRPSAAGILTNLSNGIGRFSGKGKFWNVCLEIIGESWFCTEIQAL